MKHSSSKSNSNNSEEINLSKISRIGLLGKIRKELIKEKVIEKIEITKEEKKVFLCPI